MAEKAKVTTMVIKVDLDCEKCRKKIKKVLSKIPQIQNQIFDDKANTVTITVVCCSPEKIKKKICCKGGDSIKKIEIKPPEKPKEKPKEPEKAKDSKPKEPEKAKDSKPKETEKAKDSKPKEAEKAKDSKPKEAEKPKEEDKPKAPPKEPELVLVPVYPGYPGYPPMQPCYPEGPWYSDCCGGPCYHEPYRPYYEGYGRPVYDSWGSGCSYGGGYYVGRRTGQCFSDENPSGCIIM